MKLIDMKQESNPEVKDIAPTEPDANPYPWGLRISLENEEIEKLPAVTDMEAGTMVNIVAIGKVTGNTITVTTSSTPGESGQQTRRQTVTIQIQELNVADKNNAQDAFREATEEKEPWERYPR